jgi:DNA-binding beta-propeller fold protein YncE
VNLRLRPRHLLGLALVGALAACSGVPLSSDQPTGSGSARTSGAPSPSSTEQGANAANADATRNVYAAAGAGELNAVAATARPMVYVPNTMSNTVQLIDPRTYKVVGRFRTGREPQHVVPSWDMRTLWVNADLGNSLTPIDPRTGKAGRRVAVDDPYNLYFTPDGSHALVMAERLHRIDVRDPHTMRLQRSLHVPCAGVNHADYSADLSFFVASCEFSGKLIVVNRDASKLLKVIDLNSIRTPGATSPAEAMTMPGSPKNGLRPGASAMPQDVRLTPDGTRFLAADMLRNGIWVIDATTLRVTKFIRTGMGAHGIYPSRDAARIFVSNRDAGSISVLDARTLAPVALWKIPGGGSPDMGGLTSDGTQLWLSGRYNGVVYVFDTLTGAVTHRITVDSGPHGLAVWPQPGRFSLGHTGNTR